MIYAFVGAFVHRITDELVAALADAFADELNERIVCDVGGYAVIGGIERQTQTILSLALFSTEILPGVRISRQRNGCVLYENTSYNQRVTEWRVFIGFDDQLPRRSSRYFFAFN